MGAISQPVPPAVLKKARKIALPHGGKEALHKAAGMTKPTLSTLLGTGKALPATIKKLEEGVEKILNPKDDE